MNLRSLRKLIGREKTRATLTRPARRPGHSRFLPLIDALESRALLSTLVVQNLNDSGPHSLRAEFGLAQNGDTIKFASGLTGTITLSSGFLEIATSVSINGPGANVLTVSGNNAQQVFQVDPGVTASISSLTIANGVAPASTFSNGGGVLDLGTLTVNKSTFISDSAPNWYGGGIEDDGALTVNNSIFENDSAMFGGGINSTGTLAVACSSFKDNMATNGGGGAIAYAPFVVPSAPATVTDCTISGNTGGEGGGIYNQAAMTVSNSVICNNSSPDGGSGGGVFTAFGGTLTFTDSSVTGNSATLGGGIAEDTGTVSISGCLIANNTAASPQPGNFALGGGVWVTGGFSPGTLLTIANSTLSGNLVNADTAAGGAIHADFDAVVAVTNSTFNDNTATGNYSPQGGAINIDGGAQASISGSSFVKNQAVVPSSSPYPGSSASGGAINSEGGPLTIQQSTFINNQAVAGLGGGFALGGAIINEGFGATLDLSNSVFTGNSAIGGAADGAPFGGIGSGGALVNFLASSTVVNTSFLGNQAVGGSATGSGNLGGLGFGGAIQSESGTLSITNSQFLANMATGGAGSAGATGGNGEGGAIENDAGSTLNLSSSLVSANLAQGGGGGGYGYGGGAYNANGSTATITDTLITLNFALGGSGGGQGIGGGLYIDISSGTVTLNGKTKVVGNFASTSNNNIYGTYET